MTSKEKRKRVRKPKKTDLADAAWREQLLKAKEEASSNGWGVGWAFDSKAGVPPTLRMHIDDSVDADNEGFMLTCIWVRGAPPMRLLGTSHPTHTVCYWLALPGVTLDMVRSCQAKAALLV